MASPKSNHRDYDRNTRYDIRCSYWGPPFGIGDKCKQCPFCIAEVRSIKEARETYERVSQQRFQYDP